MVDQEVTAGQLEIRFQQGIRQFVYHVRDNSSVYHIKHGEDAVASVLVRRLKSEEMMGGKEILAEHLEKRFQNTIRALVNDVHQHSNVYRIKHIQDTSAPSVLICPLEKNESEEWIESDLKAEDLKWKFYENSFQD